MKQIWQASLTGLTAAMALISSNAWAEIITVKNSDITGTVQWSSTNTYILDGFVFVEDGEVLNIEAGTVIKGKAGEGANISALVVARGGKIFASGTPTQPIIFTAEEDDVNDTTDLGIWDRGLWGGVVLIGKARINTAVDSAGNAATPKFDVYEGIPATNPNFSNFIFGGDNDDDSSGVFRYVSIRHGGKVLESNKEINGLSLCAVGRGTLVEYVETYAIKDDGFEFFGGTVNTKHLVSAFNDDDLFDTDEGHSGKHQFWFGIHASDVRDKGMELNGEPSNLAIGNQPLGKFTIYNATLIGAGKGAGGQNNNAFHIRENASPRIYNSIFTDFANRGILIEKGSQNLLASGDLDIRNNLWWGFSPDDTVANLNLNNAAVLFEDAARGNSIANPLLRSIGRTNDFGLDPRPEAGSPALATVDAAPNDGFFTPAAYKGAFDGSSLWISGWTALSQYGITPPRGGKPGNVVTVRNADITGVTSWYNTNTYVLDGFVFVENGEVLNIQAGTVVKGKTGEGANISALVVARGGKIFAEGTAENPIIFTAEEDDVNDATDLGIWDRGLWGGVVLMGKARINTSIDSNGNAANPKFDVYEGIPSTNPNYQNFFYGGDDDNDNSGVMKFVSIRHGGKVLESNKEINGLSLCAVGRGTTIECVEAYAIKDDGFEFFGGSVNTRYLISAFNDDDLFDTDEGHSGKHQFWFGIHASDVRDKGMELNGEPSNLAVGNLPLGKFTIYNATVIGAGKNAGGQNNNAFHIRENASPRIYNSIFTDFANRGILVEKGSQNLLASGDLDFRNNLWFGFSPDDSIANLNLNNAAPLFEDASRKNVIADPQLGSISRTNNLGLDPRPKAGSPALATDLLPPADGFYTQAGYQGAFGSVNWALGWTALSEYGVLTSAGWGIKSGPTAVNQPPVLAASIVSGSGKLGVAFQAPAGTTTTYQLQSTTSLITPNWVDEGAPVVSTGGAVGIETPVATDGSKFFRVITK